MNNASDLIDGVIFASAHDWLPHTRNGQKWKKRRIILPSGKKRWYYAPGEPGVPKSGMTSASRLVMTMDFADNADRAMVADALLDEGRDDEARLLRGFDGQGLIAHDGRIYQAHQVSSDVVNKAIADELNRMPPHPVPVTMRGITGSSWPAWVTLMGSPVPRGYRGFHGFHESSPAGVSEIGNKWSPREHNPDMTVVPSGLLLGALRARRMVRPDDPFDAEEFRFLCHRLPAPRDWLHQNLSSLILKGVDSMGAETEIRSLPTAAGGVGYYNVVYSDPDDSGERSVYIRDVLNLAKSVREACERAHLRVSESSGGET